MTLEKGNRRRSPILLVISAVGVVLYSNLVNAQSTCTAGYYSKYGKVCMPCSPGYYCEGGALTYMKKCQPGYYTSFKAASCTKCPPGFYCSDPSLPPIACSIDQYSVEGSFQCSTCPKGTVCSQGKVIYSCKPGELCQNGVWTVQTPCPAGYKCPTPYSTPVQCSAGYYSLENSTTCTICPIGSYCPSSAMSPRACPPGQYQDQLGQTSCLACPRGYYCDVTKSKLKILCDLGQFSPPSSDKCIDCPAGYMCASQTINAPVLCPKGTYSTGKSSYCIPCPEGFSCLDRQTTTKCGSGFYSLNGMDACLQCPPGYECSSWATPMPCAPGQYSDAGSIVCSYCPAGSYCPSTKTQPIPCAIGTYQDDIGQITCKACPDGFICPSASLNQPPVSCGDGYFTDQFHQQCYKCPAGYDCSTRRYQDLKQCQKGYYSLEGDAYCKKCPAGFYCPRVDQDKIECPINTYAYEGATSCRMCPMGYRCLDKKGKYIVKCNLGQYVDSLTTRCTQCPAGYACPNPESGFDNKVACQSGTYAIAGQAQCTICPPGKYCPNTDQAVELDCPAGKVSFGGASACQVCPKNHECGLSTMQPCPIYHYSLEGSGVCLPCPDGTQCNDLSQSTPLACPLGYYIRTLDWKCQPCPHGFYCPALAADPLPCAKHTYQNYQAQSYCFQCPDGYYSDSKSEVCKPIPPGFQRNTDPTSLRTLDKCAEGTYSSWGFKQCVVCDDGYLCPSGGEFGVHYGCPKGSYCIAGKQYKCPGGMFGIIERAKSEMEGCSICPAGFYCLAGTDDYKLNPCPRGYYCPVFTEIPQECPRGTYNDELYGKTVADCKICLMGKECDVATKDQGKTCAKGYFCPLGSYPGQWPCPAGTFSGYRSGLKDQSECMVCPAGYYCPSATVNPIAVTPGYYQPHQGIGDEQGKVICPPGYYCPNSAMTTYKGYHCTPGYYCPAGSKSATQVPCPEGTFSDSSELFDASQCLTCPGGYKCGLATTSTTVIQDCPLNQYCPPGTKLSKSNLCPAGSYAPYLNSKSLDDCIPCPYGYYCLAGQDPVLCPFGYYCPKGTEYGSQYPCPGGFYIDQLGAKVLGECKSCGLGNYCFEGSTQPIQCPPGYYNDYNNTADQCQECPPGRYCPQPGTREPLKCPPGKYSQKTSSKCTFCPVGTYCPNEATTDQEIVFQKCPAGVLCARVLTNVNDVNPTDGTTTVVNGRYGLDVYPNLRDHYCPEGQYCEYGTEYPKVCPVGTYNPLRGRKNILECKIVEPGYYVDFLGRSAPTGPCSPGYYCPEGSTSSTQVPCPAGTFRRLAAGGKPEDCTICTSGGYCPSQGMSDPLPCPAGFYCPLGTKSPEPCPEGTYSSVLGLTDSQSCTPCDPGKYCAKKNLTAPQGDCDAGYLCIKGSKRPEPDDKVMGSICPVGGFCTTGSTSMQTCDAGQFNVFTGGQTIDDCQKCWPGYFCIGQQILVPCQAGSYCQEGSSSYTGLALEGYYAPTGSDRQYQCPRGTYNSDPQKSSCISCEAGKYCENPGTIVPVDCPEGYYCPSYDSLTSQGLYYQKFKCPAGTYNSITGRKTSSDCLACPTGYYCPNPGTITPTLTCDAGYYCKSKSTEARPQVEDTNKNFGPCPPGYYCTGGDQQIPCPAGSYSNEIKATSATVCKPCTAGFYCPIPGMIAPVLKCDVGYYCPEGSATSQGRKLNEVISRKCGVGTYCPLGSAFPIVCPTGFYQDSDGSVTLNSKCKACPKGSYCVFGNMYTCPKGYICI